MKKLITSVMLVGASLLAFGQQDAQFSQNMFGKLDYNPGYAGMDKAYCFSLIGRDQWAGLPGNPETFLFNGDAYLPQIGGGAGLTIFDDQLGAEKNLEVKLSYSYHIIIGNGVLGVGPTLGFFQSSVNNTWLAPDGTNGATDPQIPAGATSATTYDLGFGAYYATPQGLYIGIASTHLSAPDVAGSGSYAKEYTFDVARHYYVMAGYTYNVSPTWDIKPDLYLESDASSTQFQIDCLGEYNKLIWFGLGYRLQDAVIGFLGVNYAFPGSKSGANLKIGYSYDFITSQIKSYSSGSHELMLQFCFKPVIVPKKESHSNVRYLY